MINMRNLVLVLASILYSIELMAQYTTPGTAVVWNLEDLLTHSGGVVSNIEDGYLINNDLTISSTDPIRLLNDNIIKFNF